MKKNLILELNVRLSVELGQKKMMLSEFLKTNHGTILELNKESKEPLTFFVNGKEFGVCEIVKMPNDKLGMRILEIFENKLPS